MKDKTFEWCVECYSKTVDVHYRFLNINLGCLIFTEKSKSDVRNKRKLMQRKNKRCSWVSSRFSSVRAQLYKK